MAMEKLKETVEKAVMDELQRENASFPLFNSKHEGYAVIKEELEETREALDTLESSIAILWESVREKRVPSFITDFNTTEDMHAQAVAVAAEAIQTAAMILKYDLSLSDKAESGGKGSE